MTACLSAELYALRMLLQNGREVTAAGSPVRLVIGWNQSGEWVAALDAACEQLDGAEEDDDAPRIWTTRLTREEWLAVVHDEEGRRRTVKDVARDLGCNEQTVRKWLKHHRIPNLCDLLQIHVWDGGETNGNELAGVSGPEPLAAAGHGSDG